MFQLTNEEGKLNLEAVDNLSKEALRSWIEARLHCQDTLVPGGSGQVDMPHFLLAEIYPTLSRHTRQDMEDIVQSFVHDMARKENADWRGDAADELLLLAQTVCGEQVVSYLAEMAQEQRFFNVRINVSVDVHYRLLQSLVALKWRGASDFWQKQARLRPDRYTGVAFMGLALISPKEAIALLTEVEWTESVEDQLFTVLPDFLEEYQVAYVIPLLECCLPDMSHRIQTALRSYMAEEGIILPAFQPTPFNFERGRNFLHSRGFSAEQKHIHKPMETVA